MGREFAPAVINPVPAKPAPADAPIAVRAIARGTYPNLKADGTLEVQARMRQIGEEFSVIGERHFADAWMEKVTDENRARKPIDPAKPPPDQQIMSITNRVRDPLKFI